MGRKSASAQWKHSTSYPIYIAVKEVQKVPEKKKKKKSQSLKPRKTRDLENQ